MGEGLLRFVPAPFMLVEPIGVTDKHYWISYQNKFDWALCGWDEESRLLRSRFPTQPYKYQAKPTTRVGFTL